MKRRSIVCVAGGATLAVALPVLAQATPKVYQVGVLTRGLPRAYFALPAALRELGYEEGRNIIFDYRSANGKSERLPGLAVELVNRKVDLVNRKIKRHIFVPAGTDAPALGGSPGSSLGGCWPGRPHTAQPRPRGRT